MVHFYLNKFFIIFCVVTLFISGCAGKSLVSKKLPLVSHAHIGHSLTAWHGTPNEQGLFVVAEKEIQIALEETSSAIAVRTNRPIINEHLSNALHALDPDAQTKGNGLGYGAIRAINEATDHMLYATQAKDSSENLLVMVGKFNDSQIVVANNMKLAVEIIHLARQTTGQEQQELINHLQNTLHAVLNGKDMDQDGVIGSIPKEIGLLQLREIISVGLRNEFPAYHPVGKKYLLGLVRLPNGSWAYKFDATNSRKHISSNYSNTFK